MNDDIAVMREKLALLEERITRMESSSGPTLDTDGAKTRLGYKSGKRFWQAVRRLKIPYSRISARQCVFKVSEIDAALLRRQVGNPQARRMAA